MPQVYAIYHDRLILLINVKNPNLNPQNLLIQDRRSPTHNLIVRGIHGNIN